MDPEEQPEELQLSEEEAALEPLVETPQPGSRSARVVIPKRGSVIAEDGTVGIAIIRPCISRGRRIRGYPPIYTPSMLAENAGVFSGWPMFMGHLPPDLAEKLHTYNRSPADMGGRVVKSYYDPELMMEDDEEFGYRKGGVVGRVIPYAVTEDIIKRDPEALHTSIQGFPTGARLGEAPWDKTKKGMLIEGIRKTPMGSVDWVIRGGAGGRVLTESEEAVITILESCYGPAEMDPADLQKMKPNELREWAEKEAPHLVEAIKSAQELQGGGGSGAAAGGGGDGGGAAATQPGAAITQEQLTEALQEQAQNLTTAIEEQQTQAREAAEEALRERAEFQQRERFAHKLIEEADGIPPKWKVELKGRYSVLPSGASPALQVEPVSESGVEIKSVEDVLSENVQADIEHTVELLNEARGGPVVEGQGGSGGSDRTDTGGKGEDELVEWLQETGERKPEDASDDWKPTDNLLEAIAD